MSHYIAYIQHNASICACQILQSFSTKNVWTLLKAFTIYVRSKFDYNIAIWIPYLKNILFGI